MSAAVVQNNIVFIVDDRGIEACSRIVDALGARCLHIDGVAETSLQGDDLVAVDVDLTDIANVRRLRSVLRHRKPPAFQAFAVNHLRRLEMVYASIVGATAILRRPFMLTDLTDRLTRHLTEDRDPAGGRAYGEEASAPSIEAAAGALGQMFDAIASEESFDSGCVESAGMEVIDAISDIGFPGWVETVRRHHESTFQHCLIVTGVATTFGCGTGMSRKDILTLTTAGLLHDIGKAGIPVAILDKPGKLTGEELDAIKRHPDLGHDYLAASQSLEPEVLGAVRFHHEYLDGSGYPLGLSGKDIGDVTRILTVCDVYGALIERRAYKAPMSAAGAFQVLDGMAAAGKLEACLVHALQTSILSQQR